MAHRPDHDLGLRYALGQPGMLGGIDRVGMHAEIRQTGSGNSLHARIPPAQHLVQRPIQHGGVHLAGAGHRPRTYHQAGAVEKRPSPSSSHDDPTKEDTMKYMLLIHQGTTPTPNSPEDWARLSQDEQNAVYAAYQKINENPGVTAGLGLAPPETATTVRVQDGRTLTTDGPFVETKEALGGYLIFEAEDLDAAIELAASIPAASMGGAIEVRPVVEW
jgi:hypothetical protein